MTTTMLRVDDMHCAACHAKIRKALGNLAAVREIHINPLRRYLFVTHADDMAAPALMARVEDLGFHPQLLGDGGVQDHALLKRFGVAALCAMQVMMIQIAIYAGAFEGMDAVWSRVLSYAGLLFCIPVVAYAAVPFFVRGLTRLRHGVNMDTPIALALCVAFAVSMVNTLTGSGEIYYDSVVMFTALLLGARLIDQRLRDRLSMQSALFDNLPATVACARASGAEVPLSEVRAGDEISIREGQRIPVDGHLLSAVARIDTAQINGEAAPHTYHQGDELLAGSLNHGAAFSMHVTRAAAYTHLAQMHRLASAAAGAKFGLSLWADRVARVFIPAVLVLAAGAGLIWLNIAPDRAVEVVLAVLVVSCPCALSLATPAALNAAIARLHALGLLVKNPRALEIAADVTDVYFDKTGTLTSARYAIGDMQTLGALGPQQCLEIAGALESCSSHPLASAFKAGHLRAQGVAAHAGEGLSGCVEGRRVRVGSAEFCALPEREPPRAGLQGVYLSVDENPAAVFWVGTDLRSDAGETIAGLHAAGVRSHLLSGDQRVRCKDVAARLGIDYIAEASPEVKQQAVGARALFVGDGLNDMLGLAHAGVAVATLETGDLVKSKADALLVSARLTPLVALVEVSRRTRRIMRQNIFWAVLYNLVAIPAAACGWVTPWLAALGMSVSSLAVMLNASRIMLLGDVGWKS